MRILGQVGIQCAIYTGRCCKCNHPVSWATTPQQGGGIVVCTECGAEYIDGVWIENT
jgi:hypothetical protein